MIDLLTFSKAVANGIATATGLETLTEGETNTFNGDISDLLILSISGTDEALPKNATFTVSYRLAYVYQPDSMSDTAAAEKYHGIYQAVATWAGGLERYSELAGAVILDADLQPWEVTYNGQAISYNIPLNFVVQF